MTFKELLKLQLYGLNQLDNKTLKKLEPALKEAERQLKSDLNRFAEHTYSYKHKRQSLRSIQATLAYMRDQSMQEIDKVAEQYNQLADEVSIEEMKTFGLTRPKRDLDFVAIEKNDFLINTAQASIDNYTAATRVQVSNAVTQGVIQNKSGYEVTTKLSRHVEMKRWKVQRIVRTELHKIFNQSKLLNYFQFRENHFPDLMKAMYHPMDNRTAEDSKQLAKINPIIPLEEEFVFKYKAPSGKVYEQRGMSTPLRPNDRGATISYRKEWDEDGLYNK